MMQDEKGLIFIFVFVKLEIIKDFSNIVYNVLRNLYRKVLEINRMSGSVIKCGFEERVVGKKVWKGGKGSLG